MRTKPPASHQLLPLLFVLAAICPRVQAKDCDFDMRLRITWDGEEESAISGAVTLSNGLISEVRRIGPNKDPDSTDIKPTEVVFTDSPASFDGLDMTVKSSLDATLTIRLSSGNEPPGNLYRIDLNDFFKKGFYHTIDGGRRIMVRAAPNDALRVDINPKKHKFRPGESLSLTIGIHNLGLAAGSPVRCTVRLIDANKEHHIAPIVVDLTVDSRWKVVPTIEPLLIPLPQSEGAFTLHISVTQPDDAHAERHLPRQQVELLVTKERDAEKDAVAQDSL